MTSAHVTLVLGGARSGKSLFAEQRANASGKEKIYIATAEAWDDEMRERIAEHKARRDMEWTTIDAPIKLAEAIASHARDTAVVLVDCLTLWLNNLIMAEHDLQAATNDLATTLGNCQGSIILVSNEVGLGIVPENALARRFRDAQGRLNQTTAATANDVYFLAAGLPMTLKSSPAA